MPVTYCERWSPKLRRPSGRLTVEQARARDRAGRPWYTAVLGEPGRPDRYVEVAWANAHLGVWFLDEAGRPWLHYGFNRVSERQLFLEAVVRWEYPARGGTRLGEAERSETVTFRQDGTVHRELADFGAGEVTLTDHVGVPLERNWEPVPEFGDYRSLARLDRDPPPG